MAKKTAKKDEQKNPFIPEEVQVASPPLPGGSPIPPPPGGDTDEFSVDLTDVQSGFVIPDDVYKVKCIDVEQSVSNTGNPTFIWTFTIIEGEFSGRDFKLWTAITPAAMWKIAEVVTALGVGATGQVVRFTRNDVLNKECYAFIEETEYRGSKRSSIIRVSSDKE